MLPCSPASHAARLSPLQICPSSSSTCLENAARKRIACRFRDGHSPETRDAANDPASSRRLINKLLQISSLSSVDITTKEEEQAAAAVLQHLQQQQQQLHQDQQLQQTQQQQQQQQDTLFEDPAAEDYDPMLLDMLGFTSVQQYLCSKVDTAVKAAKVSVLGLAAWGVLTACLLGPLGGTTAYLPNLTALTDGGHDPGNLSFLWMGLLGYYSMKGCIMSVVTGLHAWRLRAAEDEHLQDLANSVEVQHQRRAFWQLRDKLSSSESRANRTYTEFALASMLLGVLLIMGGGLEDLEMELGTVDQTALSRLLVMMWLFWESYFAAVGALLKLGQMGTAYINKWKHQHKWGAGQASRNKQQ